MRFNDIYKKIKLSLYKNMFKRIKEQDDELSSAEYFCLECIYLMDKPTISQFAEFLDISCPNATYKIKSLIKKGLIEKRKSEKDGREYILVPTKKFYELYWAKEDSTSITELKQELDKSDGKKIEKIVKIFTEK